MALQGPAILEPENPLEEIPKRSMVEFLVQHAKDRPDHSFLEFLGRVGEEVTTEKLTYAHFHQQVCRMVLELRERGIGQGDSVAILMRNSPEWLITFFAVIGLRARAVPVNYDFTADEARFYVEHAQVKLLVTKAAHSALAERLQSHCQVLQDVVFCDELGLERHDPVDIQLDADIDADDVCLIMYTSGTSTGTPKGVMLTHKNLYIGPAEFSRVLGVTEQDRILFVTPLFHANALQFATMSGLLHGATIQTVDRFSASSFWNDVEYFKPSILWTMGGILSILMSAPENEVERRARGHIRAVFGAGVANTFHAVQERICPVLMDCYGLTETSGGTYTPLDGSHLIDPVAPAVGKPLRHTKVAIMGDDEQFLGLDEVGEIVFEDRNGNIMAGYLGNPEAQAEAVRNGWFHSGDVGFVSSEDGYLHFVDRKKDIVRRAGENISSQEVEAVVREHPKVGDCAVVPFPHKVLGEVVGAYVMLTGDEELDQDELVAFCRERLSRQKVPEVIQIIDELPRTPTGKVEKFALRQRAREEGDEWRPM